MNYGLIGEKLGHSFSKPIHEQLASYTYELQPLSKEQFPAFMQKKAFHAINVTIPYKEAVIPYLTHMDQRAQRIGAVNTIVNDHGLLLGYNTDYDGFSYLLQKHKFSLQDKEILILGHGGTCKTITAVAQDRGAKKIWVASRRPQGENVVSYEQAQKMQSIQIIVNASPQGMYPQNGAPLLNISYYPHLEAVVDVIYNPLKTQLLLQAQDLGIPFANGLEMLVAQAKYAAEYFIGHKIEEQKIDEIYTALNGNLHNLVLIAMPSAGKTTLGKELASLLHKNFVDMDARIVQEAGKSIPQIFAEDGETVFRDWETKIAACLGKETGQVIATGGGIIKREENIRALRQNAIIVYIDRNLSNLLVGHGRPLSKDIESLQKMYAERLPYYLKYSDIQVENNNSKEVAVQQIKEKFYEAIGY